jgi:hypothetical protein
MPSAIAVAVLMKVTTTTQPLLAIDGYDYSLVDLGMDGYNRTG